MKKLFSLPQGVNIQLSETYSEIWARIMNVAFQTYFKNPPSLESKTAKQFKKNFEFYLQLESVFSLYQCIKVLDFMGVNYQLLIADSDHSKKMISSFYRENTNVFAYYVLTSVLLNNHDAFLSWCVKHNGSGLNMFRVKTTQSEFIELIEILIYFIKPARSASITCYFVYDKLAVICTQIESSAQAIFVKCLYIES